MSDVKYSLQLTYDKGDLTLPLPTETVTETVTGEGVVVGKVLVTTAAAMAIPLGGITAPGLCVFRNLDAANNVNFGIDDTGFVQHDAVPAGSLVVRHMDGVAPYAQADTADAYVQYVIISQ